MVVAPRAAKLATKGLLGAGLGVVAKKRKRRARKPEPKLKMADEANHIHIITTACLPWLTGTAVNPLLRAAYLSRLSRKVTLVVPWLAQEDQRNVFPGAKSFASPEDQADFVKGWVENRVGFPADFNIKFYPGRYAYDKGSILGVGDITKYIPDSEAHIAVLEEPEHLNWYHHGTQWTRKFKHVVGICHTNYLDYAKREEGIGPFKQQMLKRLNQVVTRAHCHQVIKLSDAVQWMPRQDTCFVHGVSPTFLNVGVRKRELAAGTQRFQKGVYFIGKAIWGKGYTEVVQLLKEHQRRNGRECHVDLYGSGQDLTEIQNVAQHHGLDVSFFPGRDHVDPDMHEYKVFINPSRSDVVATTTAEALAMGKFVIVEDLPCNRFFSTFTNCLVYRTSEEFSQCLARAMASEPAPLDEVDRQRLSWEAATERFLHVAEPNGKSDSLKEKVLGGLSYRTHNFLAGLEPVRCMLGAGKGTRENPANVTDVRPTNAGDSGWIDTNRYHNQLSRPSSAADLPTKA